MTSTIVAAAFRFLRPPTFTPGTTVWTDVAPVLQLQGDKPVMRKIKIEGRAGWSVTSEDRIVYIRPDKQALSGVCPHENCDVAWRDDINQFLCPCHDSKFAPDGSRISGPTMRGMEPLPSRVQDGILQVQYVSSVNGAPDRMLHR